MDRYYTLVTSLPFLGHLDSGSEIPISRLGLDKRLTMILEDDREQLDAIESLYFTAFEFWSEHSDRDIVREWNEKIKTVSSDGMRQRIEYHFELQTYLAAFRYRNSGHGHAEQFTGAGRWTGFIKRHWHEPDFSISEFFPSWQALIKAVKQGDSGRVDWQLKRLLWQDLTFYERQSGFHLDAVACYVLKWRMLSDFVQQNSESSVEYFNQLAGRLIENTEIDEVDV